MATEWASVGAVSHPLNDVQVMEEKETEKENEKEAKTQVALAAAAAVEPLPWEAVAAKLAEDATQNEGGRRKSEANNDDVSSFEGFVKVSKWNF